MEIFTIEDEFKKIEQLDDTNISIIYLYQSQIFSNKIVIKKRRIKANSEMFENEHEILDMVQHPNIIKKINLDYQFDRNTFICLEYCLHKSLYFKIPEWPETLKDKKKIILQVSEAMLYLHENGIIHRDIKSENVLLDEHMNAKLSDFGFSIITSKSKKIYEGVSGTPGFIAPEILRDMKPTYKSDVYSFGMFVYEIETKLTPFYDLSIHEISYQVCVKGKQPNFPGEIDRFMFNIMQECWVLEESKRIDSKQVVDIIQNIPC